ncbi:MAG: aminoglycoside phosphotransferase family protein, partial [Candidatus Pacearchaeota archaeon]|nr:aminoglycoside phosphotransferase family protein [Candidatus Pacearchaeota archaeon]
MFLGAAAYSRARVYRKRLKYSSPAKSKPSLIEFLVSNAWLPSSLAGACYSAQHLCQTSCFANSPLIYTFSIQTGCTIGFILYSLLDCLRRFKQPILKNIFQFGTIKKPKNLEMRIKIASQSRDALRFQEDDEMYWLKTAEIYALQNNFQKSLHALQKAIKLANKYGTSMIAKVDWSHQVSTPFISKPCSHTPADLLSSAFENAINFRLDKFEKYSSEALRLLEQEPLKRAEAKCCCATAYEFLGKHDAARKTRDAAVKEILSLPDFDKFLAYIVSGHAVYELEFDDYARSIIVLKNAPNGILCEEMNNLLRVRDLIAKEKRIDCSRFSIANPWGIYKHNNQHYLVEERALGKLLEQTFDIDLLKLAICYQAFLHARMPKNSTLINHEHDLKQVLDNVKLPLSLKQETLDFCKALFPIYSKSCVFDCDGHRANRFIDENGRIVVIDLENRGYVPPEFDLAKLLKQGLAADQSVEKELLANYTNLVKRAKSDVDVTNLECRVLAASPYKAIRYALFAVDKPTHHNTA